MEAELQKVVEEIEAEKALGRVSAVSVFRSLLNQPDLLALSSADADDAGSSNGFSSFQITLPRPMLEVDSIQLVHANIPQCVQNIPDTACVFWYYRLSSYTGLVPNARNLYFVRLLPSYYKPEFIADATNYGYNKTFNSYQDLEVELQKACLRDNAFDNLKSPDVEPLPLYKLQYLPGEIELSYNQSINKFQMRGTNTDTRMAYIEWNVGTTYGENVIVYFGTKTYISLKAGNIGNPLPVLPARSTEWWEQIYVDIVEPWEVATPYRQGQYVAFNEILYYAQVDVIGGNSPPTNASFTTDMPTDYFYRYLITGYKDPNVVELQATGIEQWNPYSLFEQGVTIQYQGQSWISTKQNKGYEPFSTLSFTAWNNTTRYRKDAVVAFGSPLSFYKATQANFNQTPSTFSTIWTRSYWLPSVTTDDIFIVGLNRISSEFDMVDTWDGIFQYPFPIGIPGQPFNPNPKRVLNSILGFTWNGMLNPAFFPEVDTFVTPTATTTIQVELLNRIRPVPQYFKRFTTGLSTQLTQATDTQVYTAEGYCNLVYSSILSIYASIMGGSTINTNQNTGLLGLSSMNAGNLGVSFYSQPIVQPLSINGADIYTLALYFEDEFGEPYFFTNNAVLSFMLKITYKNKIALK